MEEKKSEAVMKLVRVKVEDFNEKPDSVEHEQDEETQGRRSTRKRTFNYEEYADSDEEEEEDIEDDEDDEDSVKEEKFDSESDESEEGSSDQGSGSEYNDNQEYDKDEPDASGREIKQENPKPDPGGLAKTKKKWEELRKESLENEDVEFDSDSDEENGDLDTDIIYYVCLEDAKAVPNTKVKEGKNLKRNVRLPYEADMMIARSQDKESGKFKCLKCPNLYSTKSTVRNHMRELHNLDVYNCKICTLPTVYFLSELFTHHVEKHKENKFDCPGCDKPFAIENGPGEIESHYKANHVFKRNKKKKIRPRVCDICGKSVTTLVSLERHMNAHLGIKPYKCDECPFATSYLNSLNDHKRSHLKIPGQWARERVFCEICGKSFAGKNNLKEHTIIVHEKVKDRYSCKECGEKFTHSSMMRKHVARIHRGQPHPSELNKKQYKKRPPALDENGVPKPKKKYKRSVRKTGEFPCQYCNRILKTPINLRDHTRLHTGERPYICELCGDKFYSSSVLSKHKKFAHSGIPPPEKKPKYFPCEICSKVFKKKIVLTDHMNSHSGVKKYQCNHCSWSTSFKSAWRNHLRRKHGFETTSQYEKDPVFYDNDGTKQEPMFNPDESSQSQ